MHVRREDISVSANGKYVTGRFSPHLQGMKMLTLRGISLKEKLEGYTLLETHPPTVQKILGIEDINQYVNEHYELSVNPSEHELDAFLAALTGVFYLNGCYIELGDPDEGTIILPENDATMSSRYR